MISASPTLFLLVVFILDLCLRIQIVKAIGYLGLNPSTYPVTLVTSMIGFQMDTSMRGSTRQWNFSANVMKETSLSHWHAIWEHVRRWFSPLAPAMGKSYSFCGRINEPQNKTKTGAGRLIDEEKLSPNNIGTPNPSMLAATLLNVSDTDKWTWTGKVSFTVFCHLQSEDIILG